MSDISEKYYFAEWMRHIEYILYSIAIKDGKFKEYPWTEITNRYSSQLLDLAIKEDKWHEWNYVANYPSEIKLDEWIEKYKKNSTKVFKDICD